ncbi:hypothetical protein ACLB2K_063171 [Fragaria x ananassa]
MTSSSNSNTSATINPRLAYPPPPSYHDNPYEYFFHISPPRQILSGRWTPAAPRQEADSKLTYNEQKKALPKLRKEIYNPLRRISPTVNLYHRGTVVDSEKERNDNGKSCAICLEDFEPKQEVMLTPCKHMFHEECIVPWVKSNGRCPVCRFGMSDD